MYNAVMSIVGMWKEKGIAYHYVPTAISGKHLKILQLLDQSNVFLLQHSSLHIRSVPCLSSGATDIDIDNNDNDMTAIPVLTGWHGLALSCCLAGKVRTTPFRTSTGSGQSRKQLNTRPSLATVASAVLPVHFFHNNDNQHAAWRGLCSLLQRKWRR